MFGKLTSSLQPIKRSDLERDERMKSPRERHSYNSKKLSIIYLLICSFFFSFSFFFKFFLPFFLYCFFLFSSQKYLFDKLIFTRWLAYSSKHSIHFQYSHTVYSPVESCKLIPEGMGKLIKKTFKSQVVTGHEKDYLM